MVPSEVKMAPPEVLELVRCGCSSHALQQDVAVQLSNFPAHCFATVIKKKFVAIRTTKNMVVMIVMTMMVVVMIMISYDNI